MGSPKSNTLEGHHSNFDTILEELREIKDSQSHLEDSMEDLKAQLQRDYTYMTQCLQEERYRYRAESGGWRCVSPRVALGGP